MTAGFAVEPDTLYSSSVKFLDLQVAGDRITRYLAGNLAPTGGMAGDDEAGRAFAKSYDAAAASVMTGLARGSTQLGGLASGLLQMAVNYWQADAHSSFGRPGMKTAPNAAECDRSAVGHVPTAVGAGHSDVPEILRKFWPAGDTGKLREAAGVWRTGAGLVDQLIARGFTVTCAVTGSNTGDAVDAFARSWGRLGGAQCYGSPSAGAPLLANVSMACRALASACDEYASRVERQRRHLEHLAIAAGIIAGIGILGTIITLGGSDAAAGAADTAILAAAATSFEVAVETSAELAVLAEAEAIVAAAAAELPAIVPLVAETSSVGLTPAALAGIGLGVFGATFPSGPAGASPLGPGSPIGGPVGPLPPSPLSPYSRMSLPDQHANRLWMATLKQTPFTNTSDWAEYQRRVAGPTIYQMQDATHTRTIDADGYRPADAAVIDAKYIKGDTNCSVYVAPRPEQVFEPVYDKVLTGQSDEFDRYGAAIANAENRAKFLEVIVNKPEAIPYFSALLLRYHIPGWVRVEP